LNKIEFKRLKQKAATNARRKHGYGMKKCFSDERKKQMES